MDIFNLVIAQSKNQESASFWQFLRQRVALKYPFAFGNNNSNLPDAAPNNVNSNNTNNNNNNNNNSTSNNNNGNNNNESQSYNPYSTGYNTEVTNSTPYTSSLGELPPQEEHEDIDAAEWCKQIDLR